MGQTLMHLLHCMQELILRNTTLLFAILFCFSRKKTMPCLLSVTVEEVMTDERGCSLHCSFSANSRALNKSFVLGLFVSPR